MTLDFILKVGGGLGIFYACYLHLENAKLRRQVRSNTWLNYHRSVSTLKMLREILLLYKDIHRSNLNTDVLEPLIRVDSHNREFSKGLIHQVQMFEPSFEEKDFKKWHSEGKITDESIRVFRAIKLTNPQKVPLTDRFRSWLRAQLAKEKKIPSNTKAEKSS